jgi:hypothetical protein
MSTIPQELDWVSKRAGCSAVQIFKELQSGIESDVVAANKANTALGPFITALTPDGFAFIVSVKDEVGPRVVFYYANERIEVKDEKRNLKFFASLALNSSGRCVLRVDGEELEQWQFRKKALECLFFGD